MGINYNNRIFKSTSNTSNGEVSSDTVFHYNQKDQEVSAEYKRGKIRTAIDEIDKTINHLQKTMDNLLSSVKN